MCKTLCMERTPPQDLNAKELVALVLRLQERQGAHVVALGDLGDEGTGGYHRGGSRSDLLCQGTPVGSKASQPVPPNAVNPFEV